MIEEKKYKLQRKEQKQKQKTNKKLIYTQNKGYKSQIPQKWQVWFLDRICQEIKQK